MDESTVVAGRVGDRSREGGTVRKRVHDRPECVVMRFTNWMLDRASISCHSSSFFAPFFAPHSPLLHSKQRRAQLMPPCRVYKSAVDHVNEFANASAEVMDSMRT